MPLNKRACALIALTLTAGCRAALELEPTDAETTLAHHVLDAPDPGVRGSYAVRTLYYGSGTDKRRAEYRDSVTIKTPTVDASKFVDLARTAGERNRYWGFTPAEFPLNARVWYPDGAGPFPLVLVVHGNHNMKDFSDPGYDYLGELLASRGFILASIDENFINGSIRGENDARGWLLLKHLEQWRAFNDSAGNPFRGRVDMRNIALIGHSRGGEAVGHAAAFNRLPHYPDDATIDFDFNFDIRSIIAIAPVDGQYKPGDRYVPVEDVNYLTFHGSHDGDVTAFAGLRQFQRVTFSGDAPYFKSAVYVYRANHGQWNTVWGAHDSGPRSARILDLRGLLDPIEQRRFAEIFVSAFLETTLRGDERYLPLFRDHRVAGGWLPPTMYVTRFQHSSFRPLVTYDEDIDVTSGAFDGIRIRGDSLATWKESGLQLRSQNSAAEGSSMQNYAVTIGWNNRLAGDDTTRMGPPASYTLQLPDTLARAWRVDGTTTLDFLLMPTAAMPGPRKPPVDTTKQDSAAAASPAKRRDRGNNDEDEKPPIDLSVEVADAAGNVARVPLSRYGPIRRPLETHVYRRKDWEKEFAQHFETVLQNYSIPLADFVAATQALDVSTLRTVRLVFDRAPAGTIILDDVGFSRMPPAFTRVAVPE